MVERNFSGFGLGSMNYVRKQDMESDQLFYFVLDWP